MVRHVQPGEQILIDDGRVQLEVRSKQAGTVEAEVRVGGAVSSRKGVNLPDSRLPFRMSEKDLKDIRMAVEEDADFLAASYIGTPADVVQVREASREAGRALPVVAKLERRRALDHLDEIVLESDGVMVARGDLGVEIPLHQVPVVQKRIIEGRLAPRAAGDRRDPDAGNRWSSIRGPPARSPRTWRTRSSTAPTR